MLANINIIILFGLVLGSLQTKLTEHQPKVIAKLNARELNIHYSGTDRAQLYSVVDSNEIILAIDSSLLFIRNNKLVKKAYSPVSIFAFDVDKLGDGVVVGNDGYLYRINKFQVQRKKIIQSMENPKEGVVIWAVDMINDSIARFILSAHEAVYYANINYLETEKYFVKVDEVSKFISDVSPTYVGEYKGKYYTLEYDKKEKSECLVVRSDLKTRIPDKVFKFGDLGQTADETVPIRFDEDTNSFYEMLFKDQEMVLYKFDMRDYQ